MEKAVPATGWPDADGTEGLVDTIRYDPDPGERHPALAEPKTAEVVDSPQERRES